MCFQNGGEEDKVEKKSKLPCVYIYTASEAGANNFMGNVYRVSFSKEVKIAPEHLARREKFFTRPSFLREIYM